METENKLPFQFKSEEEAQKFISDINNSINKSFITFSEEDLAELNFTPEELEILEDAEAYVQTIDMIPDNYDEFEKKIDGTFSDEDEPEVTFQKLADLCQSDPDFVNQMIAVQEIYSSTKYYPEEEDSETEK